MPLLTTLQNIMKLPNEIDEYLASRNFSENTRSNYHYDLVSLQAFFEDKSLTTENLELYKIQISNLSPAAQRRKISSANQYLLFLYQRQKVDQYFKIKQVARAIADQARTIRIPVHMVETINKVLRATRKLTQELNREPTVEEIAKEMDMEPEKVAYVMKIKQDIASLDQSVGRDGDDEDSVLGDFVEDEERVTPEDSAANQILKEQLAEIISTLSDREQKIIKLRFGVGGGRPHTLEEVGAEFSVTRERIRQIEAKALSKLRKNKETKKLHEYLR